MTKKGSQSHPNNSSMEQKLLERIREEIRARRREMEKINRLNNPKRLRFNVETCEWVLMDPDPRSKRGPETLEEWKTFESDNIGPADPSDVED